MNNVFVAGSDDRLILNGVVFAFQRRGQLADSSGMVSSASLILVQFLTSKIMSPLERLEGEVITPGGLSTSRWCRRMEGLPGVSPHKSWCRLAQLFRGQLATNASAESLGFDMLASGKAKQS